jgi:hypothetical protein
MSKHVEVVTELRAAAVERRGQKSTTLRDIRA